MCGSNGGSHRQSRSGGKMDRASIPPPLLRLSRRDGEMSTRCKALLKESGFHVAPISSSLAIEHKSLLLDESFCAKQKESRTFSFGHIKVNFRWLSFHCCHHCIPTLHPRQVLDSLHITLTPGADILSLFYCIALIIVRTLTHLSTRFETKGNSPIVTFFEIRHI